MTPRETPPGKLGLDIHAVDIDGDIVVLDLNRGAYLCLPSGLGQRAVERDDGPPSLVDRLNAAGVAVVLPSEPSPYRPPPLPSSDLGIESHERLTLRDALDAMRATLQVLTAYRGRSVADLIARAGPSPRRSTQRAADVVALARRFNRWVVLAAVPDKCLVRSFMLMEFLRRHDVAATWVFGVRTWPFRAHCWVQHEGVALDDHYERLIPYSPLLAVGA